MSIQCIRADQLNSYMRLIDVMDLPSINHQDLWETQDLETSGVNGMGGVLV